MPRPIEAFVHISAMRHNLACVRSAAPGAKVWAVVKADAYGHGIERAYDALREADGFAVLDFAEAVRVRSLGWNGPILMIEGVFEYEDLDLCAQLDLWHVVHSQRQIEWIRRHNPLRPHHVLMKLNSGMNRLGFSPAAYRDAWGRLNVLPQVNEISHVTHFSDADTPRGITHQMKIFDEVTEGLPGERSVANSAATLRYMRNSGLRSDWVRVGIAVYGSAPDFPHHDIGEWGLRPTMSLSSRLIALQNLQAGDTVGYGSSFIAASPTRIGVVACGYADGYPRSCGTGTPVLVNGRRTRLVGRVSMDMLTVDLTTIPSASVGDEVTLWGHSGMFEKSEREGALMPIDDVASAAGTVGYELMCALSKRVPVSIRP